MSCMSFTATIFVALAPAQAGDNIGQAAPVTFEKKAEFAAGAPALCIMEWYITPGLECFPALEAKFPQVKGFASELCDALVSDNGRSRSAALAYLARLAALVRTTAWQRDRDDGDDLVAVALGKHAPSIRKGLENALREAQGKDRLLAAVTLLTLTADHRAALDVLANEMRAETPGKRIEACEWAGGARLTHPRLVTALAAAIRDNDAGVRSKAVLAVAQIGSHAAIATPALLEWLKTDGELDKDTQYLAMFRNRLRNDGLLPLVELDPDAKQAVPVLIERLKHDGAEKRLEGFAYLARFGPKARQAAATLRPYLTGEDEDERFGAAAALLSIDPDDAGATRVLVEGVKTHSKAIRACANTTPKVQALIPPLIDTLNDPAGETRANAARALGNMGALAESAIPPLAALVVDERRDFFDHSVAARALSSIGKASIPALANILAKPAPTRGRADAAYALGSFRDEAKVVVPVLIGALDDVNPDVRMNAAAALGRMRKASAPAREALTRVSQRQGAQNDLSAMYDYVERMLASWALTQLNR
jgi:HEAT repeat protein